MSISTFDNFSECRSRTKSLRTTAANSNCISFEWVSSPSGGCGDCIGCPDANSIRAGGCPKWPFFCWGHLSLCRCRALAEPPGSSAAIASAAHHQPVLFKRFLVTRNFSRILQSKLTARHRVRTVRRMLPARAIRTGSARATQWAVQCHGQSGEIFVVPACDCHQLVRPGSSNGCEFITGVPQVSGRDCISAHHTQSKSYTRSSFVDLFIFCNQANFWVLEPTFDSPNKPTSGFLNQPAILSTNDSPTDCDSSNFAKLFVMRRQTATCGPAPQPTPRPPNHQVHNPRLH